MPPPQRYVEPADGPPWRPMDVVCPRCARRARADRVGNREGVRPYDAPSGRLFATLRLTCPHCAQVVEGRYRGEGDGVVRLVQGHRPDERLVDLRLWLRASCCGGQTLWAFNAEHLDALEGFIAAGLREEAHDVPRGRLSFRKLPGWMVTAGHRDEVLRTIARLRATL